MTRDEYIQKVEAVLNEHTVQAASRLSAALALVPLKTKEVDIEIFVDEEGEGFLDVQVNLMGPDLHVLNRAIADYAELFETHMTEEDIMIPPLPRMAYKGETFSVQDTLADCAASWLCRVWENTERGDFHLPVTVVVHDDYGTIPSFEL